MFKENYTISKYGFHSRKINSTIMTSKLYTYPTVMKLGSVLPHLKMIEKMYKLPHTPLEFCYIGKYRQKLHFDTFFLFFKKFYLVFVNCFLYLDFLSHALSIHGAAGEGKSHLYSSLPLPPASTNIQIFICKFATEITNAYFSSQRV